MGLDYLNGLAVTVWIGTIWRGELAGTVWIGTIWMVELAGTVWIWTTWRWSCLELCGFELSGGVSWLELLWIWTFC